MGAAARSGFAAAKPARTALGAGAAAPLRQPDLFDTDTDLDGGVNLDAGAGAVAGAGAPPPRRVAAAVAARRAQAEPKARPNRPARAVRGELPAALHAALQALDATLARDAARQARAPVA